MKKFIILIMTVLITVSLVKSQDVEAEDVYIQKRAIFSKITSKFNLREGALYYYNNEVDSLGLFFYDGNRFYLLVPDTVLNSYADTNFVRQMVSDSSYWYSIINGIAYDNNIEIGDTLKASVFQLNDSVALSITHNGDTLATKKYVDENSSGVDCNNLHAYIDVTNNGNFDCNNIFLSLTASSNQTVSYSWNGSVSGDLGSSNPLLAFTAETITLTATNSTTGCQDQAVITLNQDFDVPNVELIKMAKDSGAVTLGAYVTSSKANSTYYYDWTSTGDIQPNRYSQVIKVRDVATYQCQVYILENGCNTIETIDVIAQDTLLYSLNPKFFASYGDSAVVIPMTQNDTTMLTNGANGLFTIYRNKGNFVMQGDSVQIPVTGWYKSEVTSGFSGANGDVYTGMFYVNNVYVNNRGHYVRSTSSADNGSIAMQLLYNFTAGDWLKIMIVNTGSNNDMTTKNTDWIIEFDQ